MTYKQVLEETCQLVSEARKGSLGIVLGPAGEIAWMGFS
jgi:hypothetical protein